jgi:rRNA maturation endonuclease Nob1
MTRKKIRMLKCKRDRKEVLPLRDCMNGCGKMFEPVSRFNRFCPECGNSIKKDIGVKVHL